MRCAAEVDPKRVSSPPLRADMTDAVEETLTSTVGSCFSLSLRLAALRLSMLVVGCEKLGDNGAARDRAIVLEIRVIHRGVRLI